MNKQIHIAQEELLDINLDYATINQLADRNGWKHLLYQFLKNIVNLTDA